MNAQPSIFRRFFRHVGSLFSPQAAPFVEPVAPPKKRHRNPLDAPRSDSTSGVNGISLQWKGDFGPYVCGRAFDPRAGRHRSFSYSVPKHGLERAVQMACARRRAGGAQVPRSDAVVRRLRKNYPDLDER